LPRLESVMHSPEKERYVKWRDRSIHMVSKLTDSTLYISLLISSYLLFAIFTKDSIITIDFIRKENHILFYIILFNMLVAVFWLAVNLSRLNDFRYTAKKIHNEIKGNIEGMQNAKNLYKTFGKLTWFFVYAQAISFFLMIMSYLLFIYNILN